MAPGKHAPREVRAVPRQTKKEYTLVDIKQLVQATQDDPRYFWRCRASVGVALLAGAALCGVGLARGWRCASSSQFASLLSTSLAAKAGQEAVCLRKDGIDYNGTGLYTNSLVDSAAECNRRCRADSQCQAWTWGKESQDKKLSGIERVCFFKSSSDAFLESPFENPQVISGLPCGPTPKEAPRPRTLYCWAVMQPDGYEVGLLSMQYQLSVSIFSCDEHIVFTNRTVQIGAGANTDIIHISLQAPMGGEFWTAMNTNIFLAVWSKLIQLGRYKLYDWTVKADPDCVFFPGRLRRILVRHPEGPKGVYLKNCKFGLHGPLEVLSVQAVKEFGAGANQCMEHFENECKGPCAWGEDLFLDLCLQVLGVRHDDDFDVLEEDHCDPPQNWTNCDNTAKAGFHPFKDTDQYKTCFSNGLLSEAVPRLFR